jgi:hypothetical protein
MEVSFNELRERFRSGLLRPSRSSFSFAVLGLSADEERPWRLAPATVPGHSRLPALEPAPPISENPPIHSSATPQRSRQRHPQSKSRRPLRLIRESFSLLFSWQDSKTQPTSFLLHCDTASLHCNNAGSAHQLMLRAHPDGDARRGTISRLRRLRSCLARRDLVRPPHGSGG